MLGAVKAANPASAPFARRALISKRKSLPFVHKAVNHKRWRVDRTIAPGPVAALASDASIQTDKQEQAGLVDSPYRGKTAIVIGAGPAGSVAGLLLAKRGFDVKVIEKRSNPIGNTSKIHRSIVYLINPEVGEFLVDLGVGVAARHGDVGLVEFGGSCSVTAKGEIRKRFNLNQKEARRRYLTERHVVVELLLNTVASYNLPNLELIFDTECQEIDVDLRVAKFLTPDGETKEYNYDLLVGADGIKSRVREALQSADRLKFRQRGARRNYISIRNLPFPKDAPQEFLDELSIGNLVFASFKPVWGGPFFAQIYQTNDGRVQANLAGRKGCFEAIKGREMEWLTKAATDCFPKDYFQSFVEQIKVAKPSPIGPVTYCEPYVGTNEALVGDACHSATPSLGIGANWAMLDARDLDRALGDSRGNVAAALRSYDEECRPQVAAIQELESVFPDADLEGMNPIWPIFQIVYNTFHFVGHRFLPGIIPRSAYFLMMTSAVKPTEALKRFKRAVAIWGVIAVFAVTAAVAALLRVFL